MLMWHFPLGLGAQHIPGHSLRKQKPRERPTGVLVLRGSLPVVWPWQEPRQQWLRGRGLRARLQARLAPGFGSASGRPAEVRVALLQLSHCLGPPCPSHLLCSL